ncbi:MAG TPA: hypothetical protein VL135_03180 [Terracidiphilus sp.]|jgi:hypothetical protein|nr:hypothetical protein [Terracidiphilus sp.]
MKALPLLMSGLFAVVLGAAANAQTVRPVISELGDPGKGRVEYVNDGLTPLNVVLEAKSFTVSEKGEINYRPLDPNIHLKLSATSFRIQPKQTYYVFYEASASPSPTWFVIYASFSGFAFRTAQGMNVRLQLPHTVYLLPKQRTEKADVRVVRAELDAPGNRVILEVENTGDNFGRVLQTQLASGRKKQDAPGFPIFPHSKRILEVPLEAKADTVPDEVSLQFENFKVEEKLRVKSNSDLQLASVASSVTGSTGEKP